MSFFVKLLGRTIYGRDTGSNKQMASKSCALSIVRQLFHLGVIEAFGGTLKKEKTDDMAPYPVKVSPELQMQIKECLNELNIEPPVTINVQDDQPVSLLSSHVLDDFKASVPVPESVIPWSPPQQNWNPWTGCNIDEGPLSTTTLESLSEHLSQDTRTKLQNNVHLQKIMEDRRKLPVFNMKARIMDAINRDPVIIIRGNTGCGKDHYKF